jgi:hypothetical protein
MRFSLEKWITTRYCQNAPEGPKEGQGEVGDNLPPLHCNEVSQTYFTRRKGHGYPTASPWPTLGQPYGEDGTNAVLSETEADRSTREILPSWRVKTMPAEP